MAKSFTIQKNPKLTDSSNYDLLRQKGMEYIEKLGSRLWTDYNIHDPGITMLEALAYALTDLGLRSSLDIKDLLALPSPETADLDGQYPADKRQAFYTARNILTVNPWTTDDFRKLLINIDGIKNGWLNCKKCACDDIYLYANCTKSILQYKVTEHQVIVRGLYDILLEFEEEEKSGNLNSGKIKYKFSYKNGSQLANANIEMRLPSWAKLETNKAKYEKFRTTNSEITNVEVEHISGSIPVGDFDIPDSPEQVLDNALRKPVFANVKIKFKPDKNDVPTEELTFTDVPINVWFRNIEERRALTLDQLKTAIMDKTVAGIFPKYLEKIKRADTVIAETIQLLHNHRNLAEDYCTIKAIEVEDIAICTDMEVEPSADIEAILAEAYYRIDQYMSPDIKFYSLQQLLDAKKPVDEIFEGPALSNGFIDNDELAEASLRTVLYTSDVINMIMDIPGVKSVKNFVFAKYDDYGRLVESQSWSMTVTQNRQARLYVEGSKVMVYKNGLPFLADANELGDSLQVVKGKNSQPKYSVLENDLPVPHGSYYELESYYAVQNSLPFTYGVGTDGLPDSATNLRKAQTKQLKGYLLFFEQLLVNYLAQLANTSELFAVDNTVTQTYFSRLLEAGDIDGISGLYNGLNAAILQGLIENEDTFLERRNKFMDHLLARFSETFNEYALMLYSYTEDKDIADSQLIENKISFLQNFPVLSRNRGKSFNYKNPDLVCNTENIAGLATRIKLLLGYSTNYSGNVELYEETDTDGKYYERRWRLVDKNKKVYLSSSTKYFDPELAVAEQKAWNEIDQVFVYITDPAHYTIKKSKTWVLNLVDNTGEIIATRKQSFKTKAEAEAARDEIIAFADKIITPEKIHIVEHVLLRPRAVGDPLLSVCLNSPCNDCDERDPYSFRITVVLNGEDGLANKGIEFRRFAEQTIRMQTPAHLGLKICWVSKESLKEFDKLYCGWLKELAQPEPDATTLHDRLDALLKVFTNLNNVYPQATLHDCIDGNDSNRVLLGHTAIISDAELDKQINKKNAN
ncbi:MAG TPA: hypothetical protein VFC65_08125 [Prolixibacteraceae bacterium]|nr:hypothetical protein [Prolixibacteraceae bacterium]